MSLRQRSSFLLSECQASEEKLTNLAIHEGQDCLELKPTISINFLNHIWSPQVPNNYLYFRLLEQGHYFSLTDREPQLTSPLSMPFWKTLGPLASPVNRDDERLLGWPIGLKPSANLSIAAYSVGMPPCSTLE